MTTKMDRLSPTIVEKENLLTLCFRLGIGIEMEPPMSRGLELAGQGRQVVCDPRSRAQDAADLETRLFDRFYDVI